MSALKFTAIGLCAFLAACGAAPVKVVNTDNPAVTAALLATVDGCRIWKVDDGIRMIYLANCSKSSAVSWNESCGRGCVVPRIVNGGKELN